MLKEIEFFLNECENIKQNYMSMFKNQKKCGKKKNKRRKNKKKEDIAIFF